MKRILKQIHKNISHGEILESKRYFVIFASSLIREGNIDRENFIKLLRIGKHLLLPKLILIYSITLTISLFESFARA